ncbi:uncharacterized protein PFL1_00552 [Pseudozyma flocculosa PF-1]|uniref:Uncharacterized protein n=1 Tax=Pseudozyma flocculosa TaxID=84751 RepID=A0A5C3ES46_9BASI|nr:uncharacterized protein PFL1_00552 [Pseudozyma flocculosa PF-1]EPQ32356.1 hypothetical protein PFL1_00552 [Pseudozyma flocculosa PF-1]SPO34680.1 uncharacterized protein PSFLO_00151 [Pseudozyma flocculosa]
MAATRAQAEASHSTPSSTPAKDVSSTPPTGSAAPARRTTTRTRKIPSRLLPSPSPPPSRPSSYHNPSKAARGGKEGGSLPTTPMTNPGGSMGGSSRAKKSSRNSVGSAANTPASGTELGTSSSALADGDEDTSAETLGLGKRKRRPSSMIQAPSTLTASDAPSPSAQQVGKGKKRSDTTSAELEKDRGSVTRGVPPSTTAKSRGRLSRGGSERRSGQSALLEQNPDDSDGGFYAGSAMEDSDLELEVPTAQHRALSSSGGLQLPGSLQESELSPPPLLPRCGSAARIRMPRELAQPATFTKGGLVSVSPDSSGKRAKSGLQVFGGHWGSGWSPHRAPGCLPKVGNNGASTSSSQHPWRMHEDRSAAGDGYLKVSGPRNGFAAFDRGFNFAAAPLGSGQVLSDVGSDQEDDEEDFHQAMLDGDFDMFDSQKSEGRAWAPALDHKGDASYADDTPATTPRSPQSHCEMSMPDSPGSLSDNGKARADKEGSSDSASARAAAFAAVQDAVFAHALPTTLVGADKPHQHAGSLTLSLPYSPDVVASPKLRHVEKETAMDIDADKADSATDCFATPIVSRRLHVPGTEAKAAGIPMTMKFGGLGEDAPGASQFLQFSPGIEMDSPLLGLELAAGKASEPSSPLVMAAANEGAIDAPAAMSLDEAAAPKAGPAPKLSTAAPAAVVSKVADPSPTAAPASNASNASNVVEEAKPSSNTMLVRRTAPNHPPPRHISFTVRSVDPMPVSTGPSRMVVPPSRPAMPLQMQKPAPTPSLPPPPPQPQMAATTTTTGAAPAATVSAVTTPAMDRTPELVYSGGSTSSEASSGSASPASRTDSDMAADAEVESLLFGPPEKLDLRELDQVWGGPAQTQVEASGLVSKPDVKANLSASSTPAAAMTTSLRRAKVTHLQHLDLMSKQGGA